MSHSHEILLDRRFSVTGFLATLALFLVLASVTGQVAKYLLGHDHMYGLVPLFDLDAEHNVPTYFGASLLLFACLLLTLIGVLQRQERAPYSAYWTVLALGFLYLAFDEAAKIHELFSRPTTEALGGGSSGIFHRAWVFPAMAAAALVALAFVPFLVRLPPSTRTMFVLAGFLYLGGAVGMEVVGGRYAEMHGVENLPYNAIATLEETLEMAGALLFIHGLLSYIRSNYGVIRFRFASARDARRPATQ